MQLFNKNEGTFTPDALIVSPDFPILTGGIGLRKGSLWGIAFPCPCPDCIRAVNLPH